tara:strand:+ start:401 stop:751 length:351 start_codon:yes stop_codon:yes gene_type:complete
MESNFKKKNSFEKRNTESKTIISKYPGRLPIIVEKHNSCELISIDKNKYLVPKEMTVSQFIFIIRKRINLESNQSLFVTVGGRLVSSNLLISEIYSQYKDKDGFLYFIYTSENTFG